MLSEFQQITTRTLIHLKYLLVYHHQELSLLYQPGAISGSDLIIKSGVLDLLDNGDSVMARGFTI